MTDLTPSRRAVIATLFATPMAPATSSLAWERLVKSEAEAYKDRQRDEATGHDGILAAFDAGTASIKQLQVAERKFDDLVAVHWLALDELMAEPAPNMAAALYKMELALKYELFEDFSDKAPLILADMRRLVGEPQHRHAKNEFATALQKIWAWFIANGLKAFKREK